MKKKAIHESFIPNLKVYKITPYFLTMNKMQAYIYFRSKVIQERLVKWERSRLENNNQSQVEKEIRKKRWSVKFLSIFSEWIKRGFSWF